MALCSSARTSSSPDNTGQLAMVVAILNFMVGLVLAVHFAVASTQPSFQHIVHMVDLNAGVEQTGAMSICLLCGCVAMALAGAMGCLAAQQESQGLIGAQLCLTFVLAALFLCIFAYGWAMEKTMGPVIVRQEEEFCNGTMHETYFRQLGCGELGHGATSCADQCLMRTSMLQQLGGCSFLRDLCRRPNYADLGAGACVVAALPGAVAPVVKGIGPRVEAVTARSCCQAACDELFSCAGFHTEDLGSSSVCQLASPRLPLPELELSPADRQPHCGNYSWSLVAGVAPPGALTVLQADGSAGARCFRKEATTELVEEVALTSLWLCLGSSAALVALACAATTACMLQFTLTTKRRGKKGVCALLGKLFCPCAATAATRINRKGLELEQGDSDSSDNDSGSLLG